jgi:hypothetical protein
MRQPDVQVRRVGRALPPPIVGASANDLDPDPGMHYLPDTKQEVELHLGLLLLQRMRERDLEQVAPLDPLAHALASAQKIKQVVGKFLVAKPQADSHGRW